MGVVGAPFAAIAGPAPRPISPDRPDLHDRYVGLLFFALVGYATLGKGFAYLGIAPLFIGEVVLALGLLALLRSGCLVAIWAGLPNLLLLCLMTWVLARTAPFVGAYGLNAPRDSMVVMYGLFALIVTALLIEKPARLGRVLQSYARFAWFYGIFGGLIYHATNPGFLGASVSFQMPQVRAGEAAAHLAGAGVFMVVGLGKSTRMWWFLFLVSVVMVVPSRAAMLTCLIPLILGVILSGQLGRVLPGFGIGLLILLAAYAADLEIETPGGRSVGPVQMVENVESIVGRSEASNLDGTKLWRLRWWQSIRDYTFGGDYFWTGKGFGVNLAEADGFTLEAGPSALRSPHNAHMTILSRTGVPGLLLWTATGLAWFGLLALSALRAKLEGLHQWSGIFIWILCYGAGIIINSSFDVALEGPMLGIWFWSIFGLGVGAMMIFAARDRLSAA